MKSLTNFLVKEKNVLLRVDLNVPVFKGVITDKTRIQAIESTVRDLLLKNNKIFLLSHFRRPEGKYNKKYSLRFLCTILQDFFKIKKIHFMQNFNKAQIKKQINQMDLGEICLFENVRFYKEEEKNDLNFAKNLSENFDVYVNDAFSSSHRKHASIVGITNFIPSIAGNNLMNEIKNLNKLFNNPKKYSTAIIGGSKISSKLLILENLIEIFNNLLIGGAMANTFLLAQGYNLGKSLVEKELVNDAVKILNKSKSFKTNIILPIDFVCSNSLEDSINVNFVNSKNILPDQMALDIGNNTISLFKKIILKSNMILWNGPLGAFEYRPFDHGTNKIAIAIKENAKILNIKTIAGGGDTIAAIKKTNTEDGFDYISSSGGAFLEWLEGKESPGIKALKENIIV